MESATQAIHRLSSYGTDYYQQVRLEDMSGWPPPVDDPRVLAGLVLNDVARLPWFHKRYPADLPRVPLPRSLRPTTAPAVAVLAGAAGVAPAAWDLAGLSRLLHLSAGVVRTVVRPGVTWLFRAAGSAGGRFPLELYVAVPAGGGGAVPAGVHWYDPAEHALLRVGPPPRGGVPAVVVTGVPWRTGWRYGERGFRHTYWDAGTMLSQLLAAADSAGLPAALHTRFPDAAVTALTGADGVHEWPVAVVALGNGDPALEPTGPAAAGEVDTAPREFPLATAAQRAGDLDRLGRPWDRGAPVAVPLTRSAPVEDVVLARTSQHRMARNRTLSGDLLRTAMAAALRGITVPHFVAATGVDGLAPGVYRWPDLTAPVRPGLGRDELYRVSLESGTARDAAFVVMAATDVPGLDDREYREAQLAAGLVEGRLHLVAYALGASACGMTFLDEEVPALLGEQLDPLLFTCVGVPEYTARAGGAPGSPTAVEIIPPRVLDE
ncbi:MAG TPA: hypothetical protein VGP36_25875 [Mycobacteriales bacterium]|nr:hypothetical protein [Mycobacteriales bacterium]